MQINKKQLKLLIKECLIEILSEGLGADTSSFKSPQIVPSLGTQRQVPPQKIQTINPQMAAAIREVSQKDSIMAQLLADTAQNTLPGFLNADRNQSTSHLKENKILDENNLEDIFPEAKNWENLAFSSPKLKK